MTSEEIQDEQIQALQIRVAELEAALKSYAEKDTIPPPSTLADTADLSKDAEVARKITEMYDAFAESFVPLRTDISELSTRIITLTGALQHHTDNDLRVEARLTRIEKRLSLPPLTEKADE